MVRCFYFPFLHTTIMMTIPIIYIVRVPRDEKSFTLENWSGVLFNICLMMRNERAEANMASLRYHDKSRCYVSQHKLAIEAQEDSLYVVQVLHIL